MRRASLVLASLALLLFAGHRVADANKTHEATLTGAAETGGGDPDGSGFSLVNMSPGGNEICFTIDVSGIAPATAASLHKGAAGTDGPVVATLTAPTSGTTIGCVAVNQELLKDLLKHPESYYVNVYNEEYPNGALRGQLTH